MSRPNRNGIDYYPRDIGLHNDRKFRRVRLQYGYLAVAVYELLLDIIYSDKGYYAVYNKETGEDLRWELLFGLQGPGQPTESQVSGLLNDLVAAGLFDAEKKAQGYLTSRRIQETYYKVTQQRKSISVDPAIWLLSTEEMQKLSGRSPVLHFFQQHAASPSPQTGGAESPAAPAPALSQSNGKESKRKKTEAIPFAEEPMPENMFIGLPLNDGSTWPVTHDDLAHWKELYPAVDVAAEVRKMLGWLEANPKNRKTSAGILRYITRWLGKAQDQARADRTAAPRRTQAYEELP